MVCLLPQHSLPIRTQGAHTRQDHRSSERTSWLLHTRKKPCSVFANWIFSILSLYGDVFLSIVPFPSSPSELPSPFSLCCGVFVPKGNKSRAYQKGNSTCTLHSCLNKTWKGRKFYDIFFSSGTILYFTTLIFTDCYCKTLDKPSGAELFQTSVSKN